MALIQNQEATYREHFKATRAH